MGDRHMSASIREMPPSNLLIIVCKVIWRLAASPILSDETAIKLMYRATFHKSLDLDNPITFNEKLQWMKLYDCNPLYTTLVDKAVLKKWEANKVGDDRVLPALGGVASIRGY